jgi:hypothetical protein
MLARDRKVLTKRKVLAAFALGTLTWTGCRAPAVPDLRAFEAGTIGMVDAVAGRTGRPGRGGLLAGGGPKLLPAQDGSLDRCAPPAIRRRG